MSPAQKEAAASRKIDGRNLDGTGATWMQSGGPMELDAGAWRERRRGFKYSGKGSRIGSGNVGWRSAAGGGGDAATQLRCRSARQRRKSTYVTILSLLAGDGDGDVAGTTTQTDDSELELRGGDGYTYVYLRDVPTFVALGSGWIPSFPSRHLVYIYI